MTKRHFIQLADVIREHNKQERPKMFSTIFSGPQITVLADFCASQNPRFNRERWLDYITGLCGPNGGKV